LPLDPDPGSGFPIRIWIHKVTESGSTGIIRTNDKVKKVNILKLFWQKNTVKLETKRIE
jgi:hypothetical protein